MKIIQVAKLKVKNRDNPQRYRVYDTRGIAPCLHSMGGGGLEPHIAMKVKNATKQGTIEINVGGVMNIAFPESKTRRGRVIDEGNTSPTLDTGCNVGVVQTKPCLTPGRETKRQNGRRFKEDGAPSFTLTAQDRHGVMQIDGKQVSIRKLTPKECFRLQGWPDTYFERAQFVNSDSQLYKQAGNGVTVNVIEEIAKRFPK